MAKGIPSLTIAGALLAVLVIGCGSSSETGTPGGGGAVGGAGGYAGGTGGISGGGISGGGVSGGGVSGGGVSGGGVSGGGISGGGVSGGGVSGGGISGGGIGGGGVGGGGIGGGGISGGGAGGSDGPATYESCVEEAKARGEYDECADCTCLNCLAELELCYNSPDQTLNDLCTAVVQCGRNAGCVSTQCYCGTVEPLLCGLGVPPPDGPCIAEIDAASGTTGAINIKAVKDSGDTSNAMVRAYQLSLCSQGDPLPTDALGNYLDPIPGNCDQFCNP